MCPFSIFLWTPLELAEAALSSPLPTIIFDGVAFGVALDIVSGAVHKKRFSDSPSSGSLLPLILAALLVYSTLKWAIRSVVARVAGGSSAEVEEGGEEEECSCGACRTEWQLERAELCARGLRVRAAGVKGELDRAELDVARLRARADAETARAELEETRAALAGLEETRAARAELEETRAALAECRAAMEVAREAV